MRCLKCGREVLQGRDHCSSCGAPLASRSVQSVSLELTPDEAYYGCQKIINCSGFVSPMRVIIEPGAWDGMRILIKNAQFYNESGGKVTRPICAVVRIRLKKQTAAPVRKTVPAKRRSGKKGFGAAFACLLALVLLIAAIGLGQPSNAGAASIGSPAVNPAATASPGYVPPTLLPVSIIGDDPPSPSPTQTVSPSPDPSQTLSPDPSGDPAAAPQPSAAPDDPLASQSAIRAEAAALIDNFELRYFVSAMNDTQLENFCAIYEAAINYEPSCMLPNEITEDELSDMYKVLYAECPELLHLDGAQSYEYSYRTRPSGLVYELTFSYELSEDEYRRQYKACCEVIDRLVSETEGMTDAEKEMYVYKYIALGCVYDKVSSNCGSAYGTLVDGRAKCAGISRAMKWAMEEMGIQCLVLMGDTVDSPEGHDWNVIRLDGEYYDLDVTADTRNDTNANLLAYYAYNTSDTLIRKKQIIFDCFEHFAPLPGSDTMDSSYYALAGRYVRSGDSWASIMDELVEEAMNNGGEYVGLQFESKSDCDTFLNNMNEEINDRVRAMGERYSQCYWVYENTYAYVVCFTITR